LKQTGPLRSVIKKLFSPRLKLTLAQSG